MGWRAARAAAQSTEARETVTPESTEPPVVFTEHPRLLLPPQRLRLLKRERERGSIRWVQFEALIRGSAPTPESGFAQALYYRIAGDAAVGRKAIGSALGPGTDLRQQALVFDWCQDLLTPAQSTQLAARLERAITAPPTDNSLASVRSRALASIALFDHVPQSPGRELDRIVRGWWERKTVPALLAGRDVIARDDAYPLLELLHAVRDSTNVDIRESCRRFFKDFPIEHLISHYPATYPAAENDYRIGASRGAGEPNLRMAALSRAAELAMVAFDVNAPESQVLQGWLMHDRFLLRGPFGAPYDFLWANPYQPGLSYYHVPLIYYNADFGRLFVRSNWEDSATWFGYFGGTAQLFRDGQVTVLNPDLTSGPIGLTEAVVFFGRSARRFRTTVEEDEVVFVVGLKPLQMYLVEIDNEEAYEAPTDVGGIMIIDVPHKVEVGVRMSEIHVPVRPRERRPEPAEHVRPMRPQQRPEQP
jgi:hypothetical protein